MDNNKGYILNELYFGKEALAPIQAQLSKIRKKFAHKELALNASTDAEVIKFNRMIEKFFGFHSFLLYLNPTHQINAYALPIDMFCTNEEKLALYNSIVANPTGFKFNKAFTKVDFTIALNSGLIDLDSCTDDEIMAIILHEIGHGFFESVANQNNEYDTSRRIIELLAHISQFIKDKIIVGTLVTKDNIEKEFNFISSKISGLKDQIASQIKLSLFKESMADNMKRGRAAYTNEKFADTFAAMYGYASDLHSGLHKITNTVVDAYTSTKNKQLPRFIEILKAYNMYVQNFFAYVLNTQDEHPGQLARIKVSIDYLKRELAKESLDPKIKKKLLMDMENTTKVLDDFINYSDDNEYMKVYRMYQIKLYKNFGGDRREQDTDNDALFNTIDNRYASLSKKSESADLIISAVQEKFFLSKEERIANKREISDIQDEYDKKYNAFCLSISKFTLDKLNKLLDNKEQELRTAIEEKGKANSSVEKQAASIKIKYLKNVCDKCKSMINKRQRDII